MHIILLCQNSFDFSSQASAIIGIIGTAFKSGQSHDLWSAQQAIDEIDVITSIG